MSMSQIIRLVRGCVRRYVVARVSPLENGVGLFDSQNVMVGFITAKNQKNKDRVELLLTDCIDPDKKFKQPCWDFLNDDEAEGSND